MARDEDTGDLEERTLTGKSTTQALRAVKRTLTEEQIRDEYRDEETKKLERSVYSQRSRIELLEKRTPESIDPVGMDRRLLKIEQAVGLMRWAGGVVGAAMLSGLAAALMKLFGT